MISSGVGNGLEPPNNFGALCHEVISHMNYFNHKKKAFGAPHMETSSYTTD